MTAPRHAFCSACMRPQLVDKHWLALYIDFERDGTAFVCGQTAALILFERYLHNGSFLAAHELQLAESAAEAANALTFYPQESFT